MRIRVITDCFEYMGLKKGIEADAIEIAPNSKVAFIMNMGKEWALSPSQYEVVDSDECEEAFPPPNENLMDVISTDLKKEECRSSYCECEEGKCSGGKVDMRADKIEKKESVLDIQHGGSHYKDKGIQPIEYITANNLDFCEGNIVKYASRHQDKNGAEDIRKVIHYAQFILKFQYNEDI